MWLKKCFDMRIDTDIPEYEEVGKVFPSLGFIRF